MIEAAGGPDSSGQVGGLGPVEIHCCDARALPLPDASVQCVVTSPPYFGLRAYEGLPLTTWGGDAACSHEWGDAGVKRALPHGPGSVFIAGDGASAKHGTSSIAEARSPAFSLGADCLRCSAWRGHLGNESLHDCLAWAKGEEPCPRCYVCHMRVVFREQWRVLRRDGLLILNLGDSNAAERTITSASTRTDRKRGTARARSSDVGRRTPPGLKPKDLIGVPWRVALALQADGWYLRNDVIWHKLAPLPFPALDRFVYSYEHVFVLAKSARYFFDWFAAQEASVSETASGNGFKRSSRLVAHDSVGEARGNDEPWQLTPTRRGRDVWTLGSEQSDAAHFAIMHSEIAARAIRAGASEHGCCAKCAAPWRRTFEKVKDEPKSYRGSTFTAGKTGAVAANRGQVERTATLKHTGWQPTCKCGVSERVPCKVLDPFAGSGTVPRVASEMGRHGIGGDLSATYVETIAKPLCRISPLPPPEDGLFTRRPKAVAV